MRHLSATRMSRFASSAITLSGWGSFPMTTDDELLVVLREIRDQQSQHFTYIKERLDRLDAETREQQRLSDGQVIWLLRITL